MMKKLAHRGLAEFGTLSPKMAGWLQRNLPSVIAVLFGLSGAAAVSAVLAPGLPALIFLGGATAVGLIVVYGFATGALANAAPPQMGDLAMRIMDEAPEAYLVTRRDGGIVYANVAYRQLTAFLGGDLPLPIERLVADQEEAARPLYRLARSARDGQEARQDVPVAVPGGGRTWLRVEVRPVPGMRHRSVWRIIDKGPEREAGAAKQALQLERDGLIRALDHLPVGLLTFDSVGHVLYANRTLSSLSGLSSASLSGASLERIFSGNPDVVRDRLRLAAQEGSPVELLLRARASRPGSEDESQNDEERRVLVRARTDVASDASPVLHLALWPRYDDAPRDEDLPANSLMEFLEHAPIGILVLGDDGRIRLTNPTVRALFEEAGTQAESVEDLIVPDDRAALSGLVRQLREDRSDRDGIEVRLVSTQSDTGTGRSAQIFVSRLDPVPGGAGHLILYFVDKTHQKSLEQQFAQSQKMQAIGQLAGGVAHDFNNLLTAIIGFCDLLGQRHPAGDPSFADVNQIKQNALRAANLTRQLLAFSRRQTLRPKVLQLTDVLADLSMLVRRLIGETITLKLEHDRDLGVVKVDEGQLQQVIINLVVNARDAMAEGGTLTIRTATVTVADMTTRHQAALPEGRIEAEPETPFVEIAVSDTGCGIPKENLDRIFEPFFTTKNDETAGKGTGLGLSTVYGIIQQTGGYIFVDSIVGKGTTFRIYLPREAAADAVVETAPEPESDTARDLTGAGTILLVEDEDAVRLFASRALQSRGYTVLEAANGELALEVAGAHDGAIDLVVSDVVMPGMDGPTLAGHLRDSRPDAKIVFISGYAESAFQKTVDRPEDFHFLPKPFTLKQLAETVKGVLNAA